MLLLLLLEDEEDAKSSPGQNMRRMARSLCHALRLRLRERVSLGDGLGLARSSGLCLSLRRRLRLRGCLRLGDGLGDCD
jgi:hypothetical protein